jgi:hypothetical protein
MVIGVMFSGIVAGMAATIGGLLFGLPVWLAVVLYPAAGALGAIAFIGLAFSRAATTNRSVSSGFAASYR